MPRYFGKAIKGAVDTFFEERERIRKDRLAKQEHGELRADRMARADREERAQSMHELKELGSPVKTLQKGFKSMERLKRGAMGPEEEGEGFAREEAKGFRARMEQRYKPKAPAVDHTRMSDSVLRMNIKDLEDSYDRNEEDEALLKTYKAERYARSQRARGGKPGAIKKPEEKKKKQDRLGLLE